MVRYTTVLLPGIALHVSNEQLADLAARRGLRAYRARGDDGRDIEAGVELAHALRVAVREGEEAAALIELPEYARQIGLVVVAASGVRTYWLIGK